MQISFWLFRAMALVVLSLPLMAKDEWKDSLELALKDGVVLTKTSLNGSVSTAGTVFTLQMDNIHALPSDAPSPNINVIENGQRKDANKANRLMSHVLNGRRDAESSEIAAGSRVGIKKISVENKSVMVQIISMKSEKVQEDGNTRSKYLSTVLQFQFGSDLSGVDPASVRETIWQTLKPEKPELLSAKPAAAKSTEVNRVAGSSAESAAKEPPKTSPSSSLVGKEVIDLIDKLGVPDEKLEAGSTTIFIYKALGVKFSIRDGKVVSAQ